MDIIIASFYIVSLLLATNGEGTNDKCESPQYLDFLTKGIINCYFQDDFYAVFWYNSRNYVTESPLVFLQQSIKDGHGYNSGEFDIYPNGSLIINNVSSKHDHYYTAVKLTTLSEQLYPHYIRVITVVRPKFNYPVISQCESSGDLCFVHLLNNSKIKCTVQDTKPEFSLSWAARTTAGSLNISYEKSLTLRNSLYTATVTTTDSSCLSNLLNLFVCKVDSPKGMLNKDEAFVLVQKDEPNIDALNPVRKHFQLNSQLVISCAQKAGFFVWKYRDQRSNLFEKVIYGVYNEDKLETYTTNGNDINIDNDMSLTISNVSFQYDGHYLCLYGNGTHDGMILYEVIVYALGSICIKGCAKSQFCTLEVPMSGILICDVKGIRPNLKIIWSAVNDSLGDVISLYDQETTISHNPDDTFDITLTTRYEVKHPIQQRLTVECKVVETDFYELHVGTNVELVFHDGVTTLKSSDVTAKAGERSTLRNWLIPAIILVFLATFPICTVVGFKVKKLKRKGAATEDEQNCEIPMLPTSRPTDLNQSRMSNLEKKAIFVKELKAKYKLQCATIRPLPYIRDNLYTIDKIFVEGRLLFRVESKRKQSVENWQVLDSYQNILNDKRLKSTRRILEGEPGIGKSTLSLQFANDWISEADGSSSTKNVEILILLRLRQMGNISSIYTAIKKLLLPRDTQLAEADIEVIIQNSSSVLIILDGFDEYPDQINKDDSDVIGIIKSNMLLNVEMILTTRSSCLPTEYDPFTKRIKLTGFDEKAREEYLRKVFSVNDYVAAERIKSKLSENPFLDDLCQIPLFFVMFAHTASEKVDKCTFTTVTQFFHYIISCLHNHMKNKIEDSKIEKLKFYEHKHETLDLEAFKALCRNSQNIVWDKQILKMRIGFDLYDQYLQIGILVEEEVFEKDLVEYKTEVTFYHKLFCEWYAAHFLSKYASKIEGMLDGIHAMSNFPNLGNTDDSPDDTYCLSNIDPYELQYVYRFACGLNSEAAEKIYRYLKNTHGGDKFSLLCIIEQSGKLNTFKEHIVQLCSRAVDIHGSQSKLLQRSTIHLLEVASRQGMNIASLMILNCYQSVESSGTNIRLKSGIKIPILRMLTKLVISDDELEVTEKETMDIFQFCSKCSELKILQFENCLLPELVDVKSLPTFKVDEFAVLWDTVFSSGYRLCNHTGHWENNDGSGKMTHSTYLREKNIFYKARM